MLAKNREVKEISAFYLNSQLVCEEEQKIINSDVNISEPDA